MIDVSTLQSQFETLKKERDELRNHVEALILRAERAENDFKKLNENIKNLIEKWSA